MKYKYTVESSNPELAEATGYGEYEEGLFPQEFPVSYKILDETKASFSHWSISKVTGNMNTGCSILNNQLVIGEDTNQDLIVTAHFIPRYTINFNVEGEGSKPEDIIYEYSKDKQKFTVECTPAEGYVFSSINSESGKVSFDGTTFTLCCFCSENISINVLYVKESEVIDENNVEDKSNV